MLAVIAFLIGLVLLLAIVVVLGRRKAPPLTEAGPSPLDLFIEMGRVAPPLVGMEVEGDVARVTFDATCPEEPQGRLEELLWREATRELAASGRAGGVRTLEVWAFRTVAGQRRPHMVRRGAFEAITAPPPVPPPRRERTPGVPALEERVSVRPGVAPAEEALPPPPIASELVLPDSLRAELERSGENPEEVGIEELVEALLRLEGYSLSPLAGTEGKDWLARKGRSTVFVRAVRWTGPGAYLEPRSVSRFLLGFVESGAERGILFTDAFLPPEELARARKDPRVRLVSRAGLQEILDGLALAGR